MIYMDICSYWRLQWLLMVAMDGYWLLYVNVINMDGYRLLLVATDGYCQLNMADHDID